MGLVTGLLVQFKHIYFNYFLYKILILSSEFIQQQIIATLGFLAANIFLAVRRLSNL